MGIVSNKVEELKSLLSEHPDLVHQTYCEGSTTALCRASYLGNVEATELLISHGAEVDMPSQNGNSPLIWASVRQHLGVVQALIRHGAKIDFTNQKGMTALDMAMIKGNYDITRYLCICHQQIPKKPEFYFPHIPVGLKIFDLILYSQGYLPENMTKFYDKTYNYSNDNLSRDRMSKELSEGKPQHSGNQSSPSVSQSMDGIFEQVSGTVGTEDIKNEITDPDQCFMSNWIDQPEYPGVDDSNLQKHMRRSHSQVRICPPGTTGLNQISRNESSTQNLNGTSLHHTQAGLKKQIKTSRQGQEQYSMAYQDDEFDLHNENGMVIPQKKKTLFSPRG